MRMTTVYRTGTALPRPVLWHLKMISKSTGSRILPSNPIDKYLWSLMYDTQCIFHDQHVPCVPGMDLRYIYTGWQDRYSRSIVFNGSRPLSYSESMKSTHLRFKYAFQTFITPCNWSSDWYLLVEFGGNQTTLTVFCKEMVWIRTAFTCAEKLWTTCRPVIFLSNSRSHSSVMPGIRIVAILDIQVFYVDATPLEFPRFDSYRYIQQDNLSRSWGSSSSIDLWYLLLKLWSQGKRLYIHILSNDSAAVSSYYSRVFL